MVAVVHFQNIASDVASVLDQRLRDKRRSERFWQMAERWDERMPDELGPVIEDAIASLRADGYEAVAEEIEHDYLRQWQRLRERR